MLQSSDARRAARATRRDSIQSATSAMSVPPSFGTSEAVSGDKLIGNLDSSSSSGLGIPPLILTPRDSASDLAEIAPSTPRFAQAVLHELNELQKSTTRSAVVGKINKASRPPRLSV